MTSFEDEMLDVMNKAALALLLSVGHRTKLFDTMAKLEPSTSQEIADSANLNERYVREWLGGLVTSKVIDYNPDSQKYHLTKEKSEFLTRDGNYNFASLMQWIPALFYVEDHIVDCFEKGGGAMWGKELATKMLHEAGFSKVEVKELCHDPINYYVAKL